MTDTFTIKNVAITYYGHSAFVIRHGKHAVAVDPYVKDPKAVEATDIVVTHGHGDHTGAAVEIARRCGARIIAPFETAQYFEKQGVETLAGPVGGTLPTDWGRVHFRTAMHSGFNPDGSFFGLGASALIETGGVKIYHLGDTGLHSDFKMVGEVYRPDVALVPIGGYYTMDADEALIAARWLQSPIVIPMHYGTFPAIMADPHKFKEKAENAGLTCIVLTP